MKVSFFNFKKLNKYCIFIIIVLIFSFLGFFISINFITKKYETSISYIVLQTNIQSTNIKIEDLINPAYIYDINKSIINLSNLIKDETFQNKFKEEIKKFINIENIENLEILVENPSNSNILKVKFRLNDAQKCFNISNIFKDYFISYIDKLRNENFEILLSDLEKNYNEIKVKLQDIENKINELNYGKDNINYLISLRDGYLNILNSTNISNSLIYKEIDLSNQIKYYTEKVEKLNNLLKATEQIIKLKRSILNDDLFLNLGEEFIKNYEDLLNLTVETEQINDVYNNILNELNISSSTLNGLINEKKDVENWINKIKLDIENLNKLIFQKQNELSYYELEKSLLQNKFNIISQNYINSEILKNINIPNIIIAIEPRLPIKPISPNIIMNTLASAFLGIIISILLINYINYKKTF